jgi:VIT1/CCC1 family predicted Fe2+/Mn2+ transporter
MTQQLADSPPGLPEAPAATETVAKDKQKAGKRAEQRRGIETLFRVTNQNHIALSQLADQKAGILISINGLIISVIIAVLTPRFAAWSWTLLPSLALVAGCLLSLTFAVLGARPRIDRTPVTLDDVRNNRGNLLFFGHFLSMPLADFQAGVRSLGKDRKLVHDSLSRQLYAMGDALLKKYRYLQLAYTAFLVGIGVAAAAYAIVLAALALAA